MIFFYHTLIVDKFWIDGVCLGFIDQYPTGKYYRSEWVSLTFKYITKWSAMSLIHVELNANIDSRLYSTFAHIGRYRSLDTTLLTLWLSAVV